MTALLVSPDYISHYLPIAALGEALRERGHDVVVATGPGLRSRVLADGFFHREVVLGAGRNDGVDTGEHRTSEDRENLEGFLEATSLGMVATLEYQAQKRMHDLLWEPELVTGQLESVVRELDPSIVVADQLAFGATLALRALGIPYASFLPGHPCQLPPPEEPFGYPSRRPAALQASPSELARLRDLSARAALDFTTRFNATLRALAPNATPLADAFSAGSPWLTLVNYPRSLARDRWFPARTEFIGSCVRSEAADDEFDRRRRHGDPLRVYVALGSFLSARSDVLARIIGAVRSTSMDAVVASGAADLHQLGPIPDGWVVRPWLPQVAALRACDVVICHGGNNTVTEALTVGLPVLAAPFSTDQFAGAADLVDAGLGAAIDANRSSSSDIARELNELLTSGACERAASLGRRLRRTPGSRRAAELVERVLLGRVAPAL